MQLERLLQKHGFGTRKGCRGLIRDERVAVNGTICDDPFADIPTGNLVFSVDGVDWPYAEFASLMLNKPAGYECSRKPQHHPSVLELLPVQLREREVQPIGRLDEDTTGLLLMSDDGQFIHRMSSPKKHVPKIYRVHAKHEVTAQQVERLLAGVVLDDDPRPVKAADCVRVDDHVMDLTLTEGKYHQVKRMVAAVGNRVEGLHRWRIGGLALPPDLLPGQWRWLSAADHALLGLA